MAAIGGGGNGLPIGAGIASGGGGNGLPIGAGIAAAIDGGGRVFMRGAGIAALAAVAAITNDAAAMSLNIRGRFIFRSFRAGSDTTPLNNCRGRVPQRGNSR
jgi:hypothetical protein